MLSPGSDVRALAVPFILSSLSPRICGPMTPSYAHQATATVGLAFDGELHSKAQKATSFYSV
jgi:hypothetical protein